MPTFLSQPVTTTGGPMKMEVSLTLMPAPDVLVAMVMYSAVKRPVQPSAAPTQSLLQENVVQYVPVVSEVSSKGFLKMYIYLPNMSDWNCTAPWFFNSNAMYPEIYL